MSHSRRARGRSGATKAVSSFAPTGSRPAIGRVLRVTHGGGGAAATEGASASPEAARHIADLGPGEVLPESERSFFEPRFGTDLSAVRLHSGPQASAAAESVSARAFALGSDVVFGAGEFRPGSASGRRLIAHELTHTIQQGAVRPQKDTESVGSSAPVGVQKAPQRVQRDGEGDEGGAAEGETVEGAAALGIDPSCAAHEAIIRGAWAEALDRVDMTLGMLRRAQDLTAERGGVRGTSCAVAERIRAAFGDFNGYDEPIGVDFHLGRLLTDFSAIRSVLNSGGRTARCDTQAVLTQINLTGFCDLHRAFVIEDPAGFENDVFFCPGFFGASSNPCGAVMDRANGIIHEIAHRVLGIDHEGGTFPQYGCTPLGLDFEDAVENAYAYDHLASCCGPTGECGGVAEGTETVETSDEPSEARASVDLSGGVAVQDGQVRGAFTLGTQVGLRSGQALIFQPTLGFHLLTTFGGAGDGVLGAALADVGFRLQQPLRGVYFDLAAGGYTGFRVTPDEVSGGRETNFSAGLQGGGGLGYRWDRVEVGAEARGLISLTDDPHQLLVLGRAALRF